MNLFIVEDGNYKLVVKANTWQEAKEKANNWFVEKYGKSLNLNDLGADICDNDEVIE